MRLDRIISVGLSGEDVSSLQTKLKELGFFRESITGYYNHNTFLSVSNFQKKNGLPPTGQVDIQTWSNILNFSKTRKDIEDGLLTITKNDLKIHSCSHSVDFYEEKTDKSIILISNSLSSFNLEQLPKSWSPIIINSQALKKATHFLIGGLDKKNQDGKVIRTFDDKYWSYPFYYDDIDFCKKTITIEMCNYGPLIKIDDNFFTIFGYMVDKKNVIELDHLGYKYYHKYTDSQISSLKKLLLHLKSKHNIQLKRIVYGRGGLKKFYDEGWFSDHRPNTSGVKTKNNILAGSFGITPQKEMVDMLNGL